MHAERNRTELYRNMKPAIRWLWLASLKPRIKERLHAPELTQRKAGCGPTWFAWLRRRLEDAMSAGGLWNRSVTSFG